MKAIRIAAVIGALGCIAFAGWRIYDWSREQKGEQFVLPPPRGGAAAPATVAPGPALPPLKRPASFHLATVPRHQAAEMSDDDWARAYPALRHAPFDKSGFNAVSLPWRFAATPDAGAAEPADAHAFAFLLSYDLDWSPAAFGTAHAYDVFRHSRDLLGDVEAAYDKAKVAALVEEWGGTHAVGGVLVRGKDGYVATLQVLDGDGAMVHEAAFEKPQEFFATLGDVSARALRFFGTPPNEALAAHLRRRRCERRESIAALGKAALAEPGSPEEVGLYETVLKADPKFAEARVWRANQWSWSGEGPPPAVDVAAAMLGNSALAAAALELSAGTSPLDGLPTPPSDGMRRVEGMAGEDHPVVVRWRLGQAVARSENKRRPALTREAFQPFVDAAARHPNHRELLLALVEAQDDDMDRTTQQVARYDAELVASLCLASVFNRAAAPDGFGYEWYRVAEAAHRLGRPDHVLAAVARLRQEPGAEEHAVTCASWAAEAKMQRCDFEAAAKEFAALAAWNGSEEEVIEAAVCATLAGKGEVLEQLAIDPRANVGRAAEVLAACRKYLAGTAIDRRDFGAYRGITELLIAEAELAQGGDFTRQDRALAWTTWLHSSFLSPTRRLDWALMERYYRLQPTLPHIAGFYEAAEWLHPEDPYVASVVGDWRKRGGDRSLPTPDDIVGNLAAPLQRPWQKIPPWTAIARIRRDLEEGRHEDAKRVLTAVHKEFSGDFALRAWLSRRVEEATAPRDKSP